MKLRLISFFAIAGLLLTFSCKEENTCAGIWAVEYVNPNLIAEVDIVNKTMSMQIANMLPGGIVGEAYQAYFIGDFNAVASFTNFQAPVATGSNGRAYAEMIMYNSEVPDTILDTNFVRAGISTTHIYSMIGLQTDQKIKLPTTNSGTFRIQKIGTSLLGEVIAGGETTSVSLTIPLNPIRFAFRLGSFNDSTVTGTTAIKITQFSVSGTNDCTLFSDQFKCNSIYVP